MAVKDRQELIEALDRAEASLRGVTDDLKRTKASVVEIAARSPGITVRELADSLNLSEEAVVAFAQTVGQLLEGKALSVQSARRAGLLAVAGQAWENEVGPLLSSAQGRELLGDVSRQRVDELLRARRLIGLRDSTGRRRFPAFQFQDGRPLEPLVDAYWTVAGSAASDWTAASWLASADEALDGRSPVQWAREDRDFDRLARLARQDAARLEQ